MSSRAAQTARDVAKAFVAGLRPGGWSAARVWGPSARFANLGMTLARVAHAQRSIRQPQHRIVQRALAIAWLVVVPVVDFQVALHLQATAVRRDPLAQQVRELGIEDETILPSGMLQRH